MMGLQEFDVQLYHGGTTLSPVGQENELPGMLVFDCFLATHGTRTGQIPAMAELKAHQISGISGHVHRASLVYGSSFSNEGLCWMSTPAGCQHSLGRRYIPGMLTGWQRGFGITWVYPNGRVHQYPVICSDSGGIESLTVEGREFVRSAKLKNPPPTKNWLEDLRI